MQQTKLAFLEHTGAKLIKSGNGKAQLTLAVQPFHLQHKGFVHGGVISTLLDSSGWYAAISNLENGMTALTTELKINYLKPATGSNLLAKAAVKHSGRSTSFVTIELYQQDLLIAYATASYAIVADS